MVTLVPKCALHPSRKEDSAPGSCWLAPSSPHPTLPRSPKAPCAPAHPPAPLLPAQKAPTRFAAAPSPPPQEELSRRLAALAAEQEAQLGGVMAKQARCTRWACCARCARWGLPQGYYSPLFVGAQQVNCVLQPLFCSGGGLTAAQLPGRAQPCSHGLQQARRRDSYMYGCCCSLLGRGEGECARPPSLPPSPPKTLQPPLQLYSE